MGAAQQQIAVASVAPAIFSISASQAAITNSDNSLNTTSNPAKRGGVIVIYATGFGATASSGAATTPVTVVIGGVTLNAAVCGSKPRNAGAVSGECGVAGDNAAGAGAAALSEAGGRGE